MVILWYGSRLAERKGREWSSPHSEPFCPAAEDLRARHCPLGAEIGLLTARSDRITSCVYPNFTSLVAIPVANEVATNCFTRTCPAVFRIEKHWRGSGAPHQDLFFT